MTVSATTVTQYYTGIFRQAPSDAVKAGYQAMANDAAALNSMLSAANLQVDPVIRLYQTAFNRLPDNAGMTAWVVPYSTGAITLQAISNGFTQSTEFTTLYPASMSNAQYVGALYWNILQRQGEDAGIKGWVNALNSGALTRAQVLLGFSESAEFTAKVEPGVNSFLSNIAKTPIAEQGAATLYTGNLFDQSGGGLPGETYTLTTNIETIVGTPNNDTFNGVINGAKSTYLTGDILDGAGGTNVLNVTVADVVTTADTAVQLSNIQTVNLRGLVNGTNPIDAALWTGVKTIATSNSLAVGDLAVENVASQVSVSNVASAGDISVTYTDNKLASTSATQTFVVDGAKATANPTLAVVAGGTDRITGVAVVANGAASDVMLEVTDGGGAAALKTITVTGLGKVGIDFNIGAEAGITTIDASGNSGGFTYDASLAVAVKTVKGGAGADKITLAGTAVGATIELAGGDDRLTASYGELDDATTIDGGDGVDTVSTAAVNIGNAAIFKNFEIANVTGQTGSTTFDASLLTNSTMTGLTNTGAVNADVIANGFKVGSTLTSAGDAAGGDLRVGFVDATGTSDAFNISFANAASTGTTNNFDQIRLDAIEIVNVASGGGTGHDNLINELRSNAVQSIVITGDKAFTLNSITNVTSGGLNTLTSIDGSAATGVLTITVSDLQAQQTATTEAAISYTVKGGTKADVINLIAIGTNTKATTANVDLSAGGNDDVDVSLFFSATADLATGTVGSIVNVTGAAASDEFIFDAGFTFAAGALGTKVNVSTATSIAAALELAAAATTPGTDEISWFQAGGNTYVIASTDGAYDAADTVIKFVGTVDLSTSTTAGQTLTIV